MRRLLVIALALLALTAGVAFATPPSAGNSTVPYCFYLVGSSGGVPATLGQFTVIVRDLANNPVANANVVVDLSNAADLHLCPNQLDPQALVDCLHKRVSKHTDTNGRADFIILGGSNGTGNAVALLGAGRIFESGTLIGSPTVSAFDLDGAGGFGLNDLSVWLGDFGTAGNPAYGRSDFDCSNSVGINDMAVWLTAWGRGTSTESCAAACP